MLLILLVTTIKLRVIICKETATATFTCSTSWRKLYLRKPMQPKKPIYKWIYSFKFRICKIKESRRLASNTQLLFGNTQKTSSFEFQAQQKFVFRQMPSKFQRNWDGEHFPDNPHVDRIVQSSRYENIIEIHSIGKQNVARSLKVFTKLGRLNEIAMKRSIFIPHKRWNRWQRVGAKFEKAFTILEGFKELAA